MYLLLAGICLTVWNYMRIGLVADTSWWWVLAPFLLAVLWWWWADWSGYTQRKVMQRLDDKKQHRIRRQKEALGIREKRR